LDVKVDNPGDFTAWLAAQAQPAAGPPDGQAARGLALATGKTCGMCHTIRGTAATGRAGPDLTHLSGRRSLAAGTLPMSRAAIMGWIAQPQALKPGAEMPATGLAPEDALALSHYLEGLR
jgi:cytochrome c oxidase subunit 2